MKKIVVRAFERYREDKVWVTIDTCFNNPIFNKATGHSLKMFFSLNELCIKPNMGFVPHKHKNKDYIIIPLKGVLFQKTSDGNEYLIKNRDLQFMQTGHGITHFEYNPSFSDELVCLVLEISPQQKNLEPVCETVRYTTKINSIKKAQTIYFQQDQNYQINKVSCSWGIFNKKRVVNYKLQCPKNGALLYLVDGVVYIHGVKLTANDTIFIWDTGNFYMIADKNADFIIFDFPLQ